MEESQNFGHEHPLVLLDEEHSIYNGSEEVECWRCGEKVSAPCFGCLESCGFYLHERCAKAPLVIDHPFHPHHTLVLLKNSPYNGADYICDFCGKNGEKFLYHCSCQLDLHIKCALFTINIAKNNLKELENVALQYPSISAANDGEEIEDVVKCFGCWEPLLSYVYFSPDCGFNLHKKCVELPFKLNHVFHRKHSLTLQFNVEQVAWKICQLEIPRRGFVYYCSLCKFVVHIECVSQSPIVEEFCLQHEYILCWRQSSFICDACGSEGHHAGQVCTICDIMVHKRCISLPRIIKSIWHEKHCVFHKYFIKKDDLRRKDCIICHNEVDVEHGSYYCTDCDVILHVNCATKTKAWYDIVSQENEDDSLGLLSDINSFSIIETNDAGEAIKVKHLMHMHNLMLSDGIVEDYKCCDGCMLPISASFYYCLECDFLLHKACVKLPRLKNFFVHEAGCRNQVFLISNCIFECDYCGYVSNGFAYKCNECDENICLRCATLTPGAVRCSKHEHPLLFYYNYDGQCSGCGESISKSFAFHCKICNFAIDWECFRLPIIASHKCDGHVLALTSQDNNDYIESHYCDICEERRDPRYWFYHCVTCDTSAHIKCVLGKYQFFKVTGTYEHEYHQHPLTLVKKIYYYPTCIECDEPCEDLSLECATGGCSCYIVHMKCIDYEDLKVVSALEKSEESEGVIGQDEDVSLQKTEEKQSMVL